MVPEKLAQVFIIGRGHGRPLESNWSEFGLKSSGDLPAMRTPIGKVISAGPGRDARLRGKPRLRRQPRRVLPVLDSVLMTRPDATITNFKRRRAGLRRHRDLHETYFLEFRGNDV